MTELDELAAAAAAMPQAGAEGAPGAQDQAAAQAAAAATLDDANTQALCFLAALVRTACTAEAVLNPPLHCIGVHLADDRLIKLMGPWAKVATHYGRDLGAMLPGMDHPAVAAIITTGPALWALAQDLRVELKARRRRVVDQAEPETVEA